MKMNLFRASQIMVAALALFFDISCTSVKMIQPVKTQEIELTFDDESAKQRFSGLSRGLRLSVSSSVENDAIIDNSDMTGRELKVSPNYIVTPQLRQYVMESASMYVKALGIKYNSDMSTDYTLDINVRQFKYRNSTSSPTATVILDYELRNAAGSVLIPSQTSSGRVRQKVAGELISALLEKAYMKALDGIGWDRIAGNLVGSTPVKEPVKTNELSNTVIRWNIISSPQGADVTWRVVSSTPDVKNTNGNYVGNTPYESTESFDIKGLTYNNSGNVQIEVMCEKPGYLPQKKRFNLRQAIDQKEISAKFNLVKDE